ncbi:MAG: nuclear transport factor 2 family protein [Leptolyngbyaceae cyanobacterium bins.59]|nr:nuclear transport factor 2 family protein [Leptolyngbyaceae cyanobacterium bins.59]
MRYLPFPQSIKSQKLFGLAKLQIRSQALFPVTLALTVCWSVVMPLRSMAETAATAPDALKQTLSQVDAAASKRNVQAVMQFYGADFSNSDGLNRTSFSQALTEFWQQYSKLTYRTEIRSWKPEGKGILVETITSIKGTRTGDGKPMNLDATLRSRQYVEGQKIVRQEILSERSQLTSGTRPPAVDINLPEQVTVGQSYSFDAIVKEPLGDSILLGAALEEPVNQGGYFKQPAVDLEPLQAGGIFKIGRAPTTAENRWISAVLVREDGMVMITQRLRVVDK